MSDDPGRLDSRAREVVRAKLEADAADEVAKGLRRQHRELEAAFWDDMHAYSGMKTFSLEHDPIYGSVRITRRKPTIRGRVLNKDVAVAAIQAEGLAGALLGPAEIRAKVLNELVKERLKEGTPLPDGIEATEQRGLTISIKGRGAPSDDEEFEL